MKFEALNSLTLGDQEWEDCSQEWRASFLPATGADWRGFIPLEEFFEYDGSGVMPGRTWVIAPEAESLRARWQRLIDEKSSDEQEALFQPHMRKGELGDRHTQKTVSEGLSGHEVRTFSVAKDSGECIEPVRYAFRSLDRQWIIPDKRLINQPNPTLWSIFSARQIHLTAMSSTSPTSGPAITFTSLIPDMDHYSGKGGRVFPMLREGEQTNVKPALLTHLSARYGRDVEPEDMMCYLAGIAANPAYTSRFQKDLKQPGLRIPLADDATLFGEICEIGRQVIWLHTFGERFADKKAGRPPGPPRLPKALCPTIPRKGAIPHDEMPDSISYDADSLRLTIGKGYVENVDPSVWNFQISGKSVLRQWFSYRGAARERPIIGARRMSDLNGIQPHTWSAEYTSELIHLLCVIGLLVSLEPRQAELLERVCSGPLLDVDTLNSADALSRAPMVRSDKDDRQLRLLDIES
jgi:hypothetical protein